MHGQRALATFVGATTLLARAREFERLAERTSRNPLFVLAAVLPASLSVLGAMFVADMLWPAEALPLNRYLRWVLVWTGYFTAGVSLFVGHHLYRETRTAALITRQLPL